MFLYVLIQHLEVAGEGIFGFVVGLSFRRGALGTVFYLGKKKLSLIQNILDPT